MPNLRDSNFVQPPSSVRALAALAGLEGVISVREVMDLLGDRQFGPMPVYIIGHNTNSIRTIREALDDGANAMEIDVTAFQHDVSQLCIDHAGLFGDDPGGAEAPRFKDFLRDLRQIVDEDSQRLALVVFDCKSPAATPEHGRTMLDSIRTVLTAGTDLNVILSVANVTESTPFRLDGTTMFDGIRSSMRPREAFMIDQDENLDGVKSFFEESGVALFCYSNGTSSPIADEGTMRFRTPIERACWLRVTLGGPRFVYAWTVNGRANQRLYLRVGVNGMIADPRGVRRLAAILSEPQIASFCRLARRRDNPFLSGCAFYGLTVRTSDTSNAGTDAQVTFTLRGTEGESSITVDTSFNERMERDSTNFVVVPSPNLGQLQSLTVRRDDSGLGPDWHLRSVTVDSLLYRSHAMALFDGLIGTTEPVTRALV